MGTALFFYNENRKAGQFFVEEKEMEKEMGKEKKMDMEISKMVNAIAARLG